MKIELYTRSNCSLCDQTKIALSNKNIPYKEHIIGETILREKVLDLFPDAKLLPIVTIDGVWMGGRDEVIKMLNNTNSLFYRLFDNP